MPQNKRKFHKNDFALGIFLAGGGTNLFSMITHDQLFLLKEPQGPSKLLQVNL